MCIVKKKVLEDDSVVVLNFVPKHCFELLLELFCFGCYQILFPKYVLSIV